ncbi:MAG: hypothetical protein DRJ28_10770 [Actinobacteria bacterium]|nr:MAG: hypothetical protein DRJ28_10770 [Actinomycetota bacterium]
MTRIVQTFSFLAIVALFFFGQIGSAQAKVDSCSERFPEATWDTIRTGQVSIETTGIAPALADRFRAEIVAVDG